MSYFYRALISSDDGKRWSFQTETFETKRIEHRGSFLIVASPTVEFGNATEYANTIFTLTVAICGNVFLDQG